MSGVGRGRKVAIAEQTETAPGAQQFIPPQADTLDDLRAAAALLLVEQAAAGR